MKKIRILSILNLLALLVHISISYFIQFRLIRDQGVGQVSDKYDSLFTPAGTTFAIWGLIYTALLFFCIYHVRMAYKHSVNHAANNAIHRTGVWFILNNAGAVVWLLVWTKEMIAASVILIFFQLIALIVINLRLGIHDSHSSVASKIFTQFPLSIYFAWLTIATIANTSIYLVALGWNGLGFNYTAIEWTRIMIGVAVFLTVITVFARRNVFFGLVIMWALYGIILKRQSVDAVMYTTLIKTARIGLAIVAVSCIFQFILNINSKKKVPLFPSATSSAK
jgi:hypothetical protein